MKRLALSVLLLTAASTVAAPAPFPKTERPDRGPNLEQRGLELAGAIRPGMTQTEVTDVLGDPSHVSRYHGTSRWTRGSLQITVRWTQQSTVGAVERHQGDRTGRGR
jgi:outer membrane protein assembly factor BamE (lipoprotein component of BamABCDE complex)